MNVRDERATVVGKHSSGAGGSKFGQLFRRPVRDDVQVLHAWDFWGLDETGLRVRLASVRFGLEVMA